MTVREIIKDCGGAPRIAEESKRLHALDPVLYRVAGLKAVYKWTESGIPEWHWPVVMKLSRYDEKSIHRANRDLQRGASSEKAERPKRRTSPPIAA